MKGMPSAYANEQAVVVTLTDHQVDKYTLLEKVLELSGFFDVLDDSFRKSNKKKSEFKIVIKPNLSMMLRRPDVGTYTDPFLLVHLLRLILRKGFTNLAVVESGNLIRQLVSEPLRSAGGSASRTAGGRGITLLPAW